MSSSSDVSAGDNILASQYNNLRADVVNTSTGHTHNGLDSKQIYAQYSNMLIKIQTGAESLNLDTVGEAPPIIQNYSTENTITFPIAFSSTPQVIVIAYDLSNMGLDDGIYYDIYNVGTTSFDVDIYDIDEDNDPFILHWLAIGE